MAFTKHSLATLALLLAVATPLAATAKPLGSSGCLCCMAETEACIKCRKACIEDKPTWPRQCGLVCKTGYLDERKCRCVGDREMPMSRP